MTLQLQLWILGGIAIIVLAGIGDKVAALKNEMEGIREHLEHLKKLEWVSGAAHSLKEPLDVIAGALKTPEQKEAEERFRQESRERNDAYWAKRRAEAAGMANANVDPTVSEKTKGAD